MSYSIIKKSMVYLLFAGLVLAVQPMNAMQGKAAQGAGGSSWSKIGFGIAIGALVGTVGAYAWHKYRQYTLIKKPNAQIEKDNNLPLITKNECLLYTPKNGDHEMMKYWIDRGADVNYQDNNHKKLNAQIEKDNDLPVITKNRCLLIAAKNGDRKTMKYWIDRGADVNYQDNNHNSALKYCIYNSLASLRLILEHNADPNLLSDHLGNAEGALHCIVSRYELYSEEELSEAIKLVLHYGALLHVEDRNGKTVFDKVSEGMETYQYLVSRRFMPVHLARFKQRLSGYRIMHKCIYEHVLRDIAVRIPGRSKVEEALNHRIHEDSTWIVNQYLGNENPGEDVG